MRVVVIDLLRIYAVSGSLILSSVSQVRFIARSRCCFVNSRPETETNQSARASQSLLVARLGCSRAAFGFLSARAGVQINGRNVTSHRGLPAASFWRKRSWEKTQCGRKCGNGLERSFPNKRLACSLITQGQM